MFNSLIPRVIRLKDASAYLGMDRKIFNQMVRPYLTQIPIGSRGIGFDVLDLDAWLSDHKQRNGIPATKAECRRNLKWQERKHQGSINAKGPGILINNSSGDVFAKALAQIHSK